ncbi:MULTISPECIES: class E sortase [unclassified Streptomyces]|uniref:class E sortase n=1 Tax=unclassified Streptomyces TaxID=2593676 RepID=UPI002DDB3008|nr:MULTISPECIES: class E sortase [unclassified Streptomyces]WSA93601.1 class E sortase [Streptomyces sp. NBC_01795]WSB77972.1 class E sortase [Streptomyces sp. NBC_01775]WSS13773.1 class E sortase [Streptomyces sp. NBC_01186]WSS42597.1 class E sortase [Streptomyces sp. NBC_01187]
MTTGYGDGAEGGGGTSRTESGRGTSGAEPGSGHDQDYDPYRAAVDALYDPLTDPLPGQRAPGPTPAPGPEPVPESDIPYWAQEEASSDLPYWAQEGAARPHATAPYEQQPEADPYAQAYDAPAFAQQPSQQPPYGASGYGTQAYETSTYEPSPYGSYEPPAQTQASYGAPAYEQPQAPAPAASPVREPEPAPVPAPTPAPAPAPPRTTGQPDRGTVGLRRPEASDLAHRAVSRTAAAPPASGRAHADRLPGPTRLEARRAARALRPGPGIIASRAIGEVFITFGVLMLLFVAYQLWWTNVRANQQAGGATHDLQEQWDDKQQKKGMDPERKAGAFKPGQGFAIIHIPKIDVTAPIAEGVSKSAVLDKGMVGHYYKKPLKTAMPWDDKGNFALAGHRNTHGEPFRYINKLETGDTVVVETQSKFYTYKVTRQLPSTSPSDTGVIDRVPPKSGFTEPGRYVTLTTCTPEFTSKYRLIVWGKMVDERPRSKGKPDALVD